MTTSSRIDSNELLSALGDFLAGQFGVHFARDRWDDLERGISAVASEMGFPDGQTCARWLLSNSPTKTELEVLVSQFTVGETYFFREPKTFEVIETRVLPELIRAHREKERILRIWSAGCATGEEPYSLAMLLHRLLPDLDDWNINILATDINPRFLQKAAHGVYTEWSFRSTPTWVRERYFKVAGGGRYEILPEIRRMVKFSYLNLAEDVYPALINGTNGMDLIFCRNVLMYFRHSYAQRVVENLRRCLVSGGWLVVSPVETSNSLFSSFATVNAGDVTLYAKTERCAQGTAGENRASEPAGSGTGAAESVSFLQVLEPVVTRFNERAASPAASLEPPAESFTESHRNHETPPLRHYDEDTESTDAVKAKASGIPGETQSIELLARALANQGRLAEAAECCEKAITADRLNAGCHYLHAMVEQERGRINEAMTSLKRTLYLDPEFVLAHFALGNLTRTQGQPDRAERHFSNARSLLAAIRPESILPHSEGMTAGRLMEIIQSITFRQTAA